MAQYFDNNPDLKSNKRYLHFYYNSKELTFESDAGVFSNTQIDYGSAFLVKHLLENFEYNSVCDLGCGYGFIGISLLVFSKITSVTFIDVNIKACELTRENLKKYKFDKCPVYVCDGFEGIDQTFDCIIFNPPIRAGKKVIYKLFKQSYDRLNPNGKLCIVIRKDLGGLSAYKELNNYFKKVDIVDKEKGYLIIEAVK